MVMEYRVRPDNDCIEAKRSGSLSDLTAGLDVGAQRGGGRKIVIGLDCQNQAKNTFSNFVISGLYNQRTMSLSPPSSDWYAQVVELVDTHV